MVLVDSSVWIRFLRNRSPYAEGLNRLLAHDEVVAHEFVYGELLAGDNGGRRVLLAGYAEMAWVRTLPHDEVVEFVLRRRLNGRGAGWTDLNLLASALVAGVELWTADEALAKLADALLVSYDPRVD